MTKFLGDCLTNYAEVLRLALVIFAMVESIKGQTINVIKSLEDLGKEGALPIELVTTLAWEARVLSMIRAELLKPDLEDEYVFGFVTLALQFLDRVLIVNHSEIEDIVNSYKEGIKKIGFIEFKNIELLYNDSGNLVFGKKIL